MYNCTNTLVQFYIVKILSILFVHTKNIYFLPLFFMVYTQKNFVKNMSMLCVKHKKIKNFLCKYTKNDYWNDGFFVGIPKKSAPY